MAFEAITTQEQLESVLKERLERERAKYAKFEEYKAAAQELETYKGKHFEDQIKDLQGKLTQAQDAAKGHQTALEEANARAKAAEGKYLRSAVALEKHLPAELADRLRGETREELISDAEALAKLVGAGVAPMATPEAKPAGKEQILDGAFAALSGQLIG